MIWYCLKFSVVISFLCCTTIFGNASARNALAASCFTIDIHGDETEELKVSFDRFAKSKNLQIDRSHPLGRVYSSESEHVMIHVRTHFGPFGVLTALFRFDERHGAQISDEFEKFVRNEFGGIVQVKACKDIEGFRTPQIWR